MLLCNIRNYAKNDLFICILYYFWILVLYFFSLVWCYNLFNCCYLVKKIVNNNIYSIKLHGNFGGEAGDYRCSFRR